jgi:hypothetical protein
MTDATTAGSARTPWHLWVFGGLMLLWNAFGVFDFAATLSRFEPYMGGFPQELQDYWYASPLWAWWVWGVAAIGSLLGALIVLMRQKIALTVLLVSLVCVVGSMASGYLRPDAPEGANDPVFAAVIIGLATLFLVYAWWMARRGVLR